MNAAIAKAQELAQSCGVCERYIPEDEAIYLGKVPSPKGRGYFKVPHCEDCLTEDIQLWGCYERWLTGRQLEVINCMVCSRLMVGYFFPDEKVGCSRLCKRATYWH